MLSYIACQIATLGPVGHLPKAPGTWGSLVAVLCAPWLFLPWGLPLRLCILLALFLIGAWSAGHYEGKTGRKDPGQVVIDEALGQWTSLLLVSLCTWWILALAFVLFRLLDVIKPWPIKASEKWLPGGYGVMVDDFLAGIMVGVLVLFGQ
ncbi:MAG: phosphatidylglycerophosphatase A [Desulfovermiculus sp.]